MSSRRARPDRHGRHGHAHAPTSAPAMLVLVRRPLYPRSMDIGEPTVTDAKHGSAGDLPDARSTGERSPGPRLSQHVGQRTSSRRRIAGQSRCPSTYRRWRASPRARRRRGRPGRSGSHSSSCPARRGRRPHGRRPARGTLNSYNVTVRSTPSSVVVTDAAAEKIPTGSADTSRKIHRSARRSRIRCALAAR